MQDMVIAFGIHWTVSSEGRFGRRTGCRWRPAHLNGLLTNAVEWYPQCLDQRAYSSTCRTSGSTGTLPRSVSHAGHLVRTRSGRMAFWGGAVGAIS